ncbi:MAG TPA: DUF3568 family protein [Burkholderiales bacterium]|jgi:hypothetical protein|nr:DUF3568 family protein [Burkholderiales bacterium]
MKWGAAPPWQIALIAVSLTSAGCEPVTLTAFGVGAAAGVQHTLTGIAYRTFSVPLPKVRAAVLTAFDRMGIKLGGKESIENGERLTARASDREIEIELEAITPKTTRMRSTAKSGIFRDAATATEIILQTERVLGGS